MGWRFLLDDRLREFNERRQSRGKNPLTWADVGLLVGISRQALQNLASNRELKVTNTRHLDALCRFFCCDLDSLMVAEPPIGEPLSDEELDILLTRREFGPEERPDFHIDELYSEKAQLRWRAARGSS